MKDKISKSFSSNHKIVKNGSKGYLHAFQTAVSKALENKKGGHKHNEREYIAKKIGYYPAGHRNFGDVYEG